MCVPTVSRGSEAVAATSGLAPLKSCLVCTQRHAKPLGFSFPLHKLTLLLESHSDFTPMGGGQGTIRTVIPECAVDKTRGQDKSAVPCSVQQKMCFPRLEECRTPASETKSWEPLITANACVPASVWETKAGELAPRGRCLLWFWSCCSGRPISPWSSDDERCTLREIRFQ